MASKEFMERCGLGHVFRSVLSAAVALGVCANLSGCLVAGYSSGGGFWIWPGSIVITLALVLLWWITRR
jgi:hypothetical protein